MKKFEIEGFTIRARQGRSTRDNYNLYVNLWDGDKLLSGTVMKDGTSDIDILEWGILTIKTKDKKTDLEKALGL